MLQRSILLASTIASLGIVSPAFAQDAPEPAAETSDSEIIVTARRREELLQDVPISIAVFSQDQITDRGITNAAELAAFTPSLTATTPFGGENAAFALRGFTQEVRTTPSVASYFGDVVAPRGGTLLASGDNPAAGEFFDLQNVQILRGPQGTLFGRNTTGGAVLLVPQRPGQAFGGYLQATAGDYNLVGFEGAVDLPAADFLRFRIGVNHQSRDGYLNNVGPRGPSEYGDIEYTNLRISAVADLAPNLENYTILSYSTSESAGSISQLFACAVPGGPPLMGACAPNMMSIGDSNGDFVLTGDDEGGYNVVSHVPNPESSSDRWQIINRTTWDVSESLTIVNIASYAQLEADYVNGIFGLALPSGGAAPYDVLRFTESGTLPGYHTASQDTFTEELQLQGDALGSRLEWLLGGYYEHSTPIDPAGTRSANFLACTETATPNCAPGLGVINDNIVEMDYENFGLFAQGAYRFSADWALTAGYRYTWDTTEARVFGALYSFLGPVSPGDPTGAVACGTDWVALGTCRGAATQESDAPTWLIDLDFTPSDDLLIYAKYARGYRQGSINVIGPSPYHIYEPEQVDTYEIGAKTRFDFGAANGTFNIAIFQNDFTDQQLQVAFFPMGPGSPTTGIDNAGSSSITGVELESTLNFGALFRLDLGYTYLDSQLESVDPVVPPPGYFPPTFTASVGGPLTYTPEHKFSLTGTVFLPIPETMGALSAGVTYVYTDDQLGTSTANSPYGAIPSYELVNVNVNWDSIGGGPVDASLFVSNATDERYATYVPGTYNVYGFETRYLGQPRMYGVRLRMNFGAE